MITSHSESITSLSKALLKVQAELQPAAQDATNPFCRNRYASLSSVMSACRSVLTKHGVVALQSPVQSERGLVALETIILHAESGEYLASIATCPMPKEDPQGTGTALTYLRRYGLSAMLCVITEADSDGEYGQHAEEEKWPTAEPEPDHHQQGGTALNAAVNALPELEGVSYRQITDQSGLRLVIAFGDTMNQKSGLKLAKFRWDPQQRRWWRPAA